MLCCANCGYETVPPRSKTVEFVGRLVLGGRRLVDRMRRTSEHHDDAPARTPEEGKSKR
jgi:hypothetical protein